MAIKAYRKKSPLSYTLGAYPTMELILHAPELIQGIYIHPKIDPPLRDKMTEHAKSLKKRVIESSSIERLSGKGNTFVAASFMKQQQTLSEKNPHLVLVEPSNYGNVGTILRSALGWDYRDIALVEPAADPFHPSCVRASMGAHFRLRIRLFPSIKAYQKEYPDHQLWSLMTRRAQYLEEVEHFDHLHSLILGNESRGLPDYFADFTSPLTIDTTDAIDSLNITLAAAIAMHYVYTKKRPIRR